MGTPRPLSPRPLSTERRNSSTSRRPLVLSGSASGIPTLKVKRTGEAVEPDDTEPCAGGGAGGLGRVGGGSGSSAMAMQRALSSDEFVRRSRDKRRNRQPETTGRENAVAPSLLSASNPSRPASPLLCSSSFSRPNSPVLHHHPRVPRSSAHAPSSLSAQHPSRSRSRHSLRTSPRLAAQLALPARQSSVPPPSPVLSAAPSACPEPRGSTLSLPHPNAASTEMSDVLASGEIGVGEERGKLEELLVELRDARSVPASECGDNDQEEDQILEPYIPQMPDNVHDCTLPLPIPDLPPTEPSPSPEVSMLPSPLSSPSPSARQFLPLPFEGIRRVSGASTHSTQSQSRDSGLSTSPQQRGRAPKPTLVGLGLAGPRAPSTAPTAAGEKRRRVRTPGGSLSVPLPNSHSSSAQSSSPSTINPARPPLTTYTSFEDAFGLRPPSPPASPAAGEEGEGGRDGGRKWWQLA